jgi:hypothetical protein
MRLTDNSAMIRTNINTFDMASNFYFKRDSYHNLSGNYEHTDKGDFLPVTGAFHPGNTRFASPAPVARLSTLTLRLK